jgi:hypothetical protein
MECFPCSDALFTKACRYEVRRFGPVAVGSPALFFCSSCLPPFLGFRLLPLLANIQLLTAVVRAVPLALTRHIRHTFQQIRRCLQECRGTTVKAAPLVSMGLRVAPDRSLLPY